MKKSRYTEEHIIGILKQQEAGVKTADLCREHGISAATFYGWKQKFGGLQVVQARFCHAYAVQKPSLKVISFNLRIQYTSI